MQTVSNAETVFKSKAEYPWDTILNGETWLLKRGEDYTCKDIAFHSLARATAKKRGYTVNIAKHALGLYIKANKIETVMEEKPAEPKKPKKKSKKKGKPSAEASVEITAEQLAESVVEQLQESVA